VLISCSVYFYRTLELSAVLVLETAVPISSFILAILKIYSYIA